MKRTRTVTVCAQVNHANLYAGNVTFACGVAGPVVTPPCSEVTCYGCNEIVKFREERVVVRNGCKFIIPSHFSHSSHKQCQQPEVIERLAATDALMKCNRIIEFYFSCLNCKTPTSVIITGKPRVDVYLQYNNNVHLEVDVAYFDENDNMTGVVEVYQPSTFDQSKTDILTEVGMAWVVVGSDELVRLLITDTTEHSVQIPVRRAVTDMCAQCHLDRDVRESANLAAVRSSAESEIRRYKEIRENIINQQITDIHVEKITIINDIQSEFNRRMDDIKQKQDELERLKEKAHSMRAKS